MNKNLKIVLIIAAIIAVIYFWKKKNAAESEKSDFLGLFTKKGSQKWADKLAKRYCALLKRLQKLVDLVNSGKGTGLDKKAIIQTEEEMQSIIDALAAYGYAVSTSSCKAVVTGGTKQFKPGDQLGKDCLCKSGVWAPYCCNRAKQ